MDHDVDIVKQLLVDLRGETKSLLAEVRGERGNLRQPRGGEGVVDVTILEGLDRTLTGLLKGAGTDEAVDLADSVFSYKLSDNMGTERPSSAGNNLSNFFLALK
jgi:hypothetical protein